MLIYDTLAYVDIDALKITRGARWDRMRDLAHQRQLSGPEIDELSYLYQTSAADLATIRSSSHDPDTVRLLSRDLARARATLTGARVPVAQAISRWFRCDLPAALYEIRWWTVIAMASFLVIAGVHTAYLMLNPELFSQMGSPSSLEHYAKVEFVQYYHQDTNAEFASSVWVHNAAITAGAVGSGITGIGPAYLLYANAQSVGVSAAIVFTYGGLWHFFRYILPHGMPELTAVFIGCAAGFRVFWAVLVPGAYTRGHALARAGRSMVTVAVGLVILLFVSGILEGFVTPSGLPDWLRLLLGFLVTLGVWVYTLVVGRSAYLAGYSGDLDPEQAGYYRRGN